MKFLRALAMLFRRQAAPRDAYEAEVLFSGWVDLPPLFRESMEKRTAHANAGRELSF
jgi:hypothetical protein